MVHVLYMVDPSGDGAHLVVDGVAVQLHPIFHASIRDQSPALGDVLPVVVNADEPEPSIQHRSRVLQQRRAGAHPHVKNRPTFAPAAWEALAHIIQHCGIPLARHAHDDNIVNVRREDAQ